MGNASTSTSSFDNYANKAFKQDGSVWDQADTEMMDAVPAMDFTMGVGATRNSVSREHNVKIGDDNLVFAPIAENFVKLYSKSTKDVEIVNAGFLTQQELDGTNEVAGYGVNLKDKKLF
ncbi:ABC-type sulfate transport system substrate-binding protein [Streptococcus gallinaceus]|uniref:hypothetical protein n=1 Tax=Streptococcus gallinaceus TaxID=165758 RepID=UPI0020A0BB7D|nr:hypothetical protein [Streptococcus gallinaceus]MCP1638564.1 ABC-type sulfate transport system substrate-binding protein [Streptococcus gallinaceus]MCP1769349.1 ABC-type sulfate transport system substrate-binding protein [Streptococcus gallinaceus]